MKNYKIIAAFTFFLILGICACFSQTINYLTDTEFDDIKVDGVDIKNPPEAPIYAIYDGVASKHTQTDEDGNLDGAGYYSVIKSKVNGKNIRVVYFHLQKDNRTTGVVKAGDIIGYQGDSGNLKNAIGQGHTVSHVHIKTQVNGANDDPLNHIKTKIDPKTGKVINRCN